ncbi:hypothetical protein BpHYR1_004809 [Brachionus plicatilis]|uniref:Uncharacterized protein n=1 Tax=Brachionus plicatilis TaxID=10195 RepID=A0A3M7PBZ4_BRAPC|nr:hypothetical protein BpHYR1_004809 [Brachionus plicatilis]
MSKIGKFKLSSVTNGLALHTVTAGNGIESFSTTFIVVTISYLKKLIKILDIIKKQNAFEERKKIVHIILNVMCFVRKIFGNPCMVIDSVHCRKMSNVLNFLRDSVTMSIDLTLIFATILMFTLHHKEYLK